MIDFFISKLYLVNIQTLNKRFYDYLQTFPNAPQTNFKQNNFIRDLMPKSPLLCPEKVTN